jgi:predicted RNA-binding protein with EMAP domain
MGGGVTISVITNAQNVREKSRVVVATLGAKFEADGVPPFLLVGLL